MLIPSKGRGFWGFEKGGGLVFVGRGEGLKEGENKKGKGGGLGVLLTANAWFGGVRMACMDKRSGRGGGS